MQHKNGIVVYMGAVVTLFAAAESRDEVVICTTNKKYVTNNPSSYKTTIYDSDILLYIKSKKK